MEKLKRGPCTDCGKAYPAEFMQFDHRPGEVKRGDISKMVSGTYSWETILAEIEKCDLVCTRCHGDRTWDRILTIPEHAERWSENYSAAMEPRNAT